jgi:hypothetical protein
MANKQPTAAELAAELARVRAELDQVKQKAGRSIRFKVSEKGGVSVYGLNARFPVTLYRDQWERLLDQATVEGLRSFILDNADSLASK